jgi:hypothetical protein
MIFNLTLKKTIITNLVLLVLTLIPQLTSGINVIAGIIFLILNSAVWGNWLFFKNSWTCKLLFGFLFNLLTASLIGTTFFYLGKVTINTQIITLLILTVISCIFSQLRPIVLEPKFSWPKINLLRLTLIIGYLLLGGIIVYFLTSVRTTESIRSPWEITPTLVFLLYGLTSFILYALLQTEDNKKPAIWLIVLHSLLSFCVAQIVYKIGFDYDPFIHRTNVKLIMENGTLLPKPFYYIGQYSIIIFLSRLLHLLPEYLDKLLVPIMSAIYLPVTIYYAVKDNFKTENKLAALSILALLAFPFTNFISTTPQAFANLLLLITIWLSLYYIEHPQVSLWPLFLLVLTTLTIHPLVGLPLFFFFILLLFYQHHKANLPLPKILHRSIFWEIIILGSLALPLAFLINSSTMSQLKIAISGDFWGNLLNAFSFNNLEIYYRSFISLTDLVYTFNHNTLLLAFILAIVGCWFILANKQIKKYVVFIAGFILTFCNYLLLKSLVLFFSLVSYEQQNYPKRVLEVAIYFLSPFILIAIYLVFQRLNKLSKTTQIASGLLLALTLSCSFYLSYPRVDKITENHGYSTSATDIKTVNFIENLQRNRPYTVLAAQPVSAATIQELGFKYYHNGYFFYPVPTGGRLYELYENLAYGKNDSGDVIATTQYLTGVNDVYFVLNSYWLNATEIMEVEKEKASEWFSLDNKNFIFHYTKK